MKHLILLLSFFTLSLNCMEEKPWTPWSTNIPTIMEHYEATRILNRVAQTYEGIRIGVQEDPAQYTKKFLQTTNIRYINALRLIKKIHGWPTQDNFDEKCAEGAWLIAQQSDDLEFQQECLQELGKLKSLTALQHYAYLLDRIQVMKGQPQHFGTMSDRQGRLYPILGYAPNPANLAQTELQLEVVNRQRELIGFLSLQDEQAKLSHFIMMQQMLTDSHDPQPTELSQ